MDSRHHLKQITQEQFHDYINIYGGIPPILGQEIAWFSDNEEKKIATIFFDRIDSNFSAVIFERNVFGCFAQTNLEVDFPTPEDALQWIIKIMNQPTLKNETQSNKLELFKDIVDVNKQNPIYKQLKNEPEWNSAKNLINEIIPLYTDIDGNFIQQFQSEGFDQRLWELYLFNYFNEENLEIDRSKSSPDFVLKKDKYIVGVEAVTISNRNDVKTTSNTNYKVPDENYLQNDMPLLWSGVLFNKLEHKSQDKGKKEKEHYWEKEGLGEKPFVIAVQDFHKEFSMTWSQNSLSELLYGFRYSAELKDDNLVITPHKVESYTKINGTKISSGFFFSQPNAKYLSAVIANPLGTLPKFNRIGKELGYDKCNTIMLHHGLCYNHEINAVKPKQFRYIVKEGKNEKWGDGVVVYHNPNCLYPLDEEMFPNACHYRLKNNLLETRTPPFSPFSSMTTILKTVK